MAEITNPKTGVTITDADLRENSIAWMAGIIKRDWTNVYFGAVPYLDAMRTMDAITDQYGADDGPGIVSYFLSNASSYRGPVAKAIKTELKARRKRAVGY